jgi:hypothetical protein
MGIKEMEAIDTSKGQFMGVDLIMEDNEIIKMLVIWGEPETMWMVPAREGILVL